MACTREFKLLIRSAKQIVQVVKNRKKVVVGEDMKRISVLGGEENDKYSIVVSRDGNIYDIGPDSEILEKYKNDTFEKEIDACGKCVLPGLVDAHTHPVWAGDRVNEFAMKLAGATYMEVHKAGGGIYYTVDHTKAASEDHLLNLLKARLWEMLRSGTTLVEAKSGYGLDAENELKMLHVIQRAKKETPIEISSTFCGAHAVPRNMTSDQATNSILTSHLPLLKQSMATGNIEVDNIDVFCEEGVFSVEQSRQILQAGKQMGLKINFHGDELHPVGAAEMGAKLGAEAISHLEEISDLGIEEMAKAGSVAVILPTTAYMLKLTPPPVRKMIKAGVPVALGSDFNPNAFCLSMPLVMHLACVLCGMSMTEALNAATINAAAALGKSSTHGSLEVGKVADIIIINAERWEHLIYQMGNQSSIINSVIKNGSILVENNKASLI